MTLSDDMADREWRGESGKLRRMALADAFVSARPLTRPRPADSRTVLQEVSHDLH